MVKKRGSGGVLSARSSGGSTPLRATITPAADSNSERAPVALIAGLLALILLAVP